MEKKNWRPFDRDKLEREAAIYEKWAKEESNAEWRKYHEAKAKKIRRILAVTDRMWGKPKKGRNTKHK